MHDVRRPPSGPLAGPLLALCLLLSAGSLLSQTPADPVPPPAEAPPEAPATPPSEPAPASPAPASPAPQPLAEPLGEPIPAPGEDPPGSLPETTGEPTVPPASATPGPPPIPGASPDRINFQLPFPEEDGGGMAAGSAGDLEFVRDDYAVLTGGVKLRYQDIDVEAQEAQLNLKTKVVTARGDVILDQGPRRLTGETLEFDLDTKLGKLTEATGQVSPDYYFRGREVEKVADDVYIVTDGIFTSCNQEVPDWSFKLGQARVEAEGYARVRNASMRAKNVPFFYTPYILWPTKRERTSGFLVPNFGYSDRRGASLGLAYFQTLGRSYDTTFHVDTYTEGFLGIGNEFRYQPSEGTRGNLLAYMIRDPEAPAELDEWRWKVEWNTTTTDLPLGMRGGVALQEFSDFQFFREFERDFDRNTLRFIDSRAFMSGNWGPHLVNLLVNDRETFITQRNSVDQRRLPEVEYRLRSTRIGRTPFYAQFEGSASYLDLSRPGVYEGSFGRIDAFPQLSLPIRSFPWLNLRVTGGGRMTYYTDSLTEPVEGQPQTIEGDAVTRVLPFGSAQVIGPSFSRIFQDVFGFARLKHVIEPRWTYTYLGEFDDDQDLPQFDEVDRLFSNNSGRFALVNRVLAKVDEKGTAREVFSFSLARNFSLDDERPLQRSLDGMDTSAAGPLEAEARWSPGGGTTLRAEARYDTLLSTLISTELSTNFNLGGGARAGLTWYTREVPNINPEFTRKFNQVRVNGGFNVLPRRLRIEGQVNYDLEKEFLQQQRWIVNWAAQCYGLRLEWRDFRADEGQTLRDKDFRFSLTLKNVGTFLDLTSRSSSQEN